MMVKTQVHFAGLLVVASSILSGAGCREEETDSKATAGFGEWFPFRIGTVNFKLQVAVTPEEKEVGLMNRESLPVRGGMLFAFRRADRRKFWMSNTLIPLDIGYFSTDGVLREIHAAYPLDERSVPSHSDRIRFVVELKQGGYAEAGLKPGAKLDMQALAHALRMRGYVPMDFGLAEVHSDSNISR